MVVGLDGPLAGWLVGWVLACPFACLHACLPTCLPACHLARLPACLLAYWPACLRFPSVRPRHLCPPAAASTEQGRLHQRGAGHRLCCCEQPPDDKLSYALTHPSIPQNKAEFINSALNTGDGSLTEVAGEIAITGEPQQARWRCSPRSRSCRGSCG